MRALRAEAELKKAIRAVRPAGVDSKTRTDRDDGSHAKDIDRVSRFLEAARSEI